MADAAEQADQLLTLGHVYLWGGELLQANKESTWSLLYIDQHTGLPLPPGPNVLNGYILVRDVWYEALYQSADSDKRIVGPSVDIDLAQFKDIATSGEINLVEGHIYSGGKDIFVALHTADHPDFSWSLYRMLRSKNTVEPPRTPGELAGYQLDTKRYWYELRIGDPQAGEKKLKMRLCPYFEKEIMPTLKHVANSLQNYVNGMA